MGKLRHRELGSCIPSQRCRWQRQALGSLSRVHQGPCSQEARGQLASQETVERSVTLGGDVGQAQARGGWGSFEPGRHLSWVWTRTWRPVTGPAWSSRRCLPHRHGAVCFFLLPRPLWKFAFYLPSLVRVISAPCLPPASLVSHGSSSASQGRQRAAGQGLGGLGTLQGPVSFAGPPQRKSWHVLRRPVLPTPRVFTRHLCDCHCSPLS